MIKVAGIILKILSTVMVCTVVILAVLLAGLRLVGLTPYTVLSGSMEPTYHVGSVIYVKDVDPSDLKVGDPLTFRLTGDVIATHRIIEIVNEDTAEPSFITKGDANDNADGLTPASAVVGKPVFSIPYLGFISSFVQKPAGLICIVSCTAVILLLSSFVDELYKRSESAKKDETKNNG